MAWRSFSKRIRARLAARTVAREASTVQVAVTHAERSIEMSMIASFFM
jgi:hypothetical protein